MTEQARTIQLIQWLQECFPTVTIQLSPLTGDAGFRRYFRFKHNNKSYVAVDAPPQWSNNVAFAAVQQSLASQNVNVPTIYSQNLALGFFCLEDFGDKLLSLEIDEKNMASFYRQAIKILPDISTASEFGQYELPNFDKAFITRELEIFVEWLLNEHLDIHLTTDDINSLNQCFSILAESAISQPQVVMHRDFHSRNILILDNKELGVIDFQDAVIGPITYDVVSLLRDCYLKWPDDAISPLFQYFIQIMTKTHNLEGVSKNQWQRWFDLMGVQRHVKAAGIFARLHHRDNKPAYLNDIPLTLSYISDISRRYPELNFLTKLIDNRVVPTLRTKVALSLEECKK